MRGPQRPNFWAVGILAFCLTVWGVSLLAVAKTAHIYTHKSPAGFRHDLMARTKHHWRELESLVGVGANPAPRAATAAGERI
jgi:hypothetical protein